ncbi:hypothetical protein [Vibrio diabolicus]|uniref:hypothetical protein n=1 Tax=Vibrio diabolicus TaxID=50719 RepID=UPI00211B6A0F|nr:hypothetical protein [Vibrio diabolicus]MCG6219270.1 hypothetical protein [Vibrio diabolicus]
MTQNIEQRTEAAVSKYEGAAGKIEQFAETDSQVDTSSGSRKSFPKLSREIEEKGLESLRLGAANHQGIYAVGVSYDEPNWTYTYNGQQWGLNKDYDLSTLPYETTEVDPNNDWNLAVRGESSQDYVQAEVARGQGENLGGEVYPPGNRVLKNGDVVTEGTTHLRVSIGGKPKLVSLSSFSSGVVSGLTDEQVIIGGILIKFTSATKLESYDVYSLIADLSVYVGLKVSTGSTVWKVVESSNKPGINLDSGLYAIPLNGVYVDDFGDVSYNDDSEIPIENYILSTKAIDDALKTKATVILGDGIYIVDGGVLYTRQAQKLRGNGFGKTILKLNSSELSTLDECHIVEMESFSIIDDIEIDGNGDAAIAGDVGNYASGIFTSRYLTNGKVSIAAESCTLNVYVHDTLGANIVPTGSKHKINGEFIDSKGSHNIYVSNGYNISFGVVTVGGTSNPESVVLGTNTVTGADHIHFNRLTIKDISTAPRGSINFSPPGRPHYLTGRVAGKTQNCTIDSLEIIDDKDDVMWRNSIRAQANWRITIGSLTVTTRLRTSQDGEINTIVQSDRAVVSIETLNCTLNDGGNDVGSGMSVIHAQHGGSIKVNKSYINAEHNTSPNFRVARAYGTEELGSEPPTQITLVELQYKGVKGAIVRTSALDHRPEIYLGDITVTGSLDRRIEDTESTKSIITGHVVKDSTWSSTGAIQADGKRIIRLTGTGQEITSLSDCYDGQEVILIGNANAIIKHTSLLVTRGGVDFTPGNGEVVKLTVSNGVAYQ